jgi:protein transport protein SEC61 subunit beta
MAKAEESRNQLQQYKKRQTKLNELLNEQPSRLQITPMQVLMVSLLFIGNVFFLHVLGKFVPPSVLPQVAIAVVMVVVSMLISFAPSK